MTYSGYKHTLRAVLVDDEEDLRELARAALELDGRWTVVGQASDGQGAVAVATTTQPDLVLLDLEMPWLDGAEALPDIKRAAPHACVVVWTAHPTGARARSAADLGAGIILGKGDVPASRLSEVLIAAMRAPVGTPRSAGTRTPQPSPPVPDPHRHIARRRPQQLAFRLIAISLIVLGATMLAAPTAGHVAFQTTSAVVGALPWLASGDDPAKRSLVGPPGGNPSTVAIPTPATATASREQIDSPGDPRLASTSPEGAGSHTRLPGRGDVGADTEGVERGDVGRHAAAEESALDQRAAKPAGLGRRDEPSRSTATDPRVDVPASPPSESAAETDPPRPRGTPPRRPPTASSVAPVAGSARGG